MKIIFGVLFEWPLGTGFTVLIHHRKGKTVSLPRYNLAVVTKAQPFQILGSERTPILMAEELQVPDVRQLYRLLHPPSLRHRGHVEKNIHVTACQPKTIHRGPKLVYCTPCRKKLINYCKTLIIGGDFILALLGPRKNEKKVQRAQRIITNRQKYYSRYTSNSMVFDKSILSVIGLSYTFIIDAFIVHRFILTQIYQIVVCQAFQILFKHLKYAISLGHIFVCLV